MSESPELESRGRIFTIPNALSFSRLGLVVVLLLLAWSGYPNVFLVCFVLSLLTDFFDGFLARRLNQVTRLGSQLDSWADVTTSMVMPICVWMLWRDIIINEAPFIAAAVASYMTPNILGLIRYRHLPSFHTWGAKFCTFAMGVAVVCLLARWSPWPFRILVPFVVLEALEEIVMIFLLPRWHPGVPSLWHGIKIYREMKGEE